MSSWTLCGSLIISNSRWATELAHPLINQWNLRLYKFNQSSSWSEPLRQWWKVVNFQIIIESNRIEKVSWWNAGKFSSDCRSSFSIVFFQFGLLLQSVWLSLVLFSLVNYSFVSRHCCADSFSVWQSTSWMRLFNTVRFHFVFFYFIVRCGARKIIGKLGSSITFNF